MKSLPINSFTPSYFATEDESVLRQRALQQGYLYFPQLLESGLVQALRERVLLCCAELGLLAEDCNPQRPEAAPGVAGLPYDHPTYIELQSQVLGTPECLALRENETLAERLKSASGYRLSSGFGDVIRITFPNSLHLTTQPHQEAYYVTSCQMLWNAWIPLVDCGQSLGPLALLPASYSRPLLPHLMVPDAPEAAGRYAVNTSPETCWTSGDLHCGDVVLFSGFSVHCALPNLSRKRLRLSVDFRYGR